MASIFMQIFLASPVIILLLPQLILQVPDKQYHVVYI